MCKDKEKPKVLDPQEIQQQIEKTKKDIEELKYFYYEGSSYKDYAYEVIVRTHEFGVDYVETLEEKLDVYQKYLKALSDHLSEAIKERENKQYPESAEAEFEPEPEIDPESDEEVPF